MRWLTGRLKAALEALPVVVLTGARQTGKTTLTRGLPQRRSFLSLDDLDVLGQARSDPDSLLVSRPLTVDEVQRAPELLLPIQRRVGRSHRFQRGVVLHGGAGRPLGAELWALPWGWMLPAQGCPPTQTGVEP